MQNAHNNYDIEDFHRALLDIIGVMNHPLRDEKMMQAAGVTLDQVLFPLLVTVERFGPLGVVDLADRVGRDYTTVSRQVKKMLALGLVEKQSNARDRRISEVTVTASGKALCEKIDHARQRLMNATFTDWAEEDVLALFRLMRRYADTVKGDDRQA